MKYKQFTLVSITLLTSLLVSSANAGVLDLQLLQNGVAGMFYDVETGVWYAGVSSPLVVFKDLSLDIGAVKDIESSGKDLPVLGLNLHLGSVIGRKWGQFIQDVTPDGLLEQLTVGAWGTAKGLDIQPGQFPGLEEEHWGWYSGLSWKF